MASVRSIWRPLGRSTSSVCRCSSQPRLQRYASAAAAEGAATPPPRPELANLETDSSLARPPPEKDVGYINPLERSRGRKKQLPSNRYQYHPPKYNRGPLHPIQSPPSSDPIARDFIPGPFNIPRLKETYETTLASDIMTLTYQHKPPGTGPLVPPAPSPMRAWDDSSPYHKNRPMRAPRGKRGFRPVERDIMFTNIPELREVTVSTFVPEGIKSPDLLVVAQMVLQCITGVVPEATKIKHNVAPWKVHKGELSGYKATMYGDRAYEFLDRLVHLVLPRIKDWKGARGSSGDGSGNVALGMTPSDVVLFPEIEVNQPAYPPKSIPGLNVIVKTTATSDRHARLLLQALGIPFYGSLKR